MSKIKLKKLSLQYSYLKLEKEDILEDIKNSETEIRESFKEMYPEYYSQLLSPSDGVETTNKIHPEENHLEHPITPSIPKNKDSKKLYRKIVEKTHPDKLGDNSKSDIFHQACRAYEEQDMARLLEIASSLNIELAELHPETLALLENNIKKLSMEISNIKTSVAWAWTKVKTIEEKKELLDTILKNKGIL